MNPGILTPDDPRYRLASKTGETISSPLPESVSPETHNSSTTYREKGAA